MVWRWSRYVAVGLFGMVVTWAGIVEMSPAPVSLPVVQEIDGIAERGGRLELLFEVKRTRWCPVTVERQMWKWVDVAGEQVRYVVPLPHLDVASGPPGESRLIVSLPVPPGIPPGPWFYASQSYSFCPALGWLVPMWPTVSPDVPVIVLPTISQNIPVVVQ